MTTSANVSESESERVYGGLRATPIKGARNKKQQGVEVKEATHLRLSAMSYDDRVDRFTLEHSITFICHHLSHAGFTATTETARGCVGSKPSLPIDQS